MSEDLAWAAGFYDGEGHTRARNRSGRHHVVISISQKDRRVLDKFVQVVGYGKVFGPYIKNGGVCYQYMVQRSEDACVVLDALWPHLGDMKREQAILAVAAYMDNPVLVKQTHCKRNHDRTLPNAVDIRGRCRKCSALKAQRYRERQRTVTYTPTP